MELSEMKNYLIDENGEEYGDFNFMESDIKNCLSEDEKRGKRTAKNILMEQNIEKGRLNNRKIINDMVKNLVGDKMKWYHARSVDYFDMDLPNFFDLGIVGEEYKGTFLDGFPQINEEKSLMTIVSQYDKIHCKFKDIINKKWYLLSNDDIKNLQYLNGILYEANKKIVDANIGWKFTDTDERWGKEDFLWIFYFLKRKMDILLHLDNRKGKGDERKEKYPRLLELDPYFFSNTETYSDEDFQKLVEFFDLRFVQLWKQQYNREEKGSQVLLEQLKNQLLGLTIEERGRLKGKLKYALKPNILIDRDNVCIKKFRGFLGKCLEAFTIDKHCKI